MEKTLALCCIVKNEEKVLPRLVESVRGIIDYWVLVDTGSTDGTKSIIPEIFKGIPGELHERPWVNFGHNRTELCKLAKGKADYLLLLDADMTATLDGFDKSTLTEAGYHLRYSGPLDYAQMLLVRGNIDWRYEGVTHEFITCSEPLRVVSPEGIIINHHLDGGCRADKLERDLRLLRHGVIDEPENSRYFFYIAQTLKDMGLHEEALGFYNKRIGMGGWPEEIWYSMYQCGKMASKMDDVPKARTAFLESYEYRPNRSEPLFFLGKMLREKKQFNQSVMFLEAAKKVAYPTRDLLFIEKPIYDYFIDYELSVAYYWAKKYSESIVLCEHLLDNPDVPKGLVASINQNKQFSINAVDRDASNSERVLITGAGGMLGFAVYNFFKQKYNHVAATDIDLNEKWIKYMDVTDEKSCDVVFEKYKPTIVIHLAAVGSSSSRLSDDNEISRVNVHGTKMIAGMALKYGSKLVYISTAEIFSGSKKEYTEDDIADPNTLYGDTKLEGEGFVLANVNSYVVRTEWLMGCFLKDNGVLRGVYEKIKRGDTEISVPVKHKGAPTYTYNLAESIYFLINYAKPGVYHQQSNGTTSWHGAVKKFVELLGLSDVVKVKNIVEPHLSRKLINKRTAEKGIDYMFDWERAMEAYVNEISQYEQFKDKAVVIVGEDKNDHLWDAFFKYFEDYWDRSLDARVYFISENKDAKYNGIVNIKTGKHPFGKRLALGLQQIQEKNVLLLLDDYFLTKKVDARFFEEAFGLMGKYEMDRLGVNFRSKALTYESLNIRVQNFQVHKIKEDSKYAMSLHGIWKRESLLSCLGVGDTREDVEINATARMREAGMANSLYYCPAHDDWYVDAVEGKFLTGKGHEMLFAVPENAGGNAVEAVRELTKTPVEPEIPDADINKAINALEKIEAEAFNEHIGVVNKPACEISVLIPVYNRPELLAGCLTSLLRQTFKDFRVCIYDDGSGERVKAVVDNFSSSLSIEYKRGEVNRGVGYAKQRLLEMIDTPYACWMDSDDQASQERLEKQLEYIKEHDVDMVYCQMRWMPSGNMITADVSKYTSWEGMQNNTCDPTALFKQRLAVMPYMYVKHGSDSLWLYSLIRAGATFGMVDLPLYYYREHNDRIGVHKRKGDWQKELNDGRKMIDAMIKNDFTVVSMFTTGTNYEQEAQMLKDSAQKFKVPLEVYEVPNLGSWVENANQKVSVILDALMKYKGAIVWTDADSVFNDFPELFNHLSCDIAAHKIEQWNEILSGTVYFAYNETTINFLKAWMEMGVSGTCTDAVNMQFLLESREDIIFDRLPAEYVKIFDNPHQQCNDPVIVHNQASRRLKNTLELHSDIVKIKNKIKGYDSCAVIGNGPFESDLSEEIDNSFVMRCNDYRVGEGYEGVGSKTDLNISSLYHEIIPTEYTAVPILGVLPIHDTVYQQYTDAKKMHIFWKENADKLRQMGISVYTYGDSDTELMDLFRVVSREIQAFPTVGIMGIALALKLGFKKIVVSGFTFFESDKSHYFKDEKVVPSSHHNVRAEKKLFESWVNASGDIEWVLDELTKKAVAG